MDRRFKQDDWVKMKYNSNNYVGIILSVIVYNGGVSYLYSIQWQGMDRNIYDYVPTLFPSEQFDSIGCSCPAGEVLYGC